jgi:hypothetical protein
MATEYKKIQRFSFLTMGKFSTAPLVACAPSRLLYCFASFLWILPSVSSFVVKLPHFVLRHPMILLNAGKTGSLDVEFDRVNPDADGNRDEDDGASFLDEKSKNLFDLSLDADPDFIDSRIPFIDYSSKSGTAPSYIDVKLAFMADLDGVQYGIAIPFDSAAALTLEKEDGSVQYLSPDLDDNEELMAIMATQLQEHVGPDLRLKRTPRVLTISGPLDKYTADWKEKLLPDPIEPNELMGKIDDGDEIEFFHKFMRDELGEDEYQKTLNETPDYDEMKNHLSL